MSHGCAFDDHSVLIALASHKSYHPYLDKNKQRVRDDEARAAVLQEEEERNAIKTVSRNQAWFQSKEVLTPCIEFVSSP